MNLKTCEFLGSSLILDKAIFVMLNPLFWRYIMSHRAFSYAVKDYDNNSKATDGWQLRRSFLSSNISHVLLNYFQDFQTRFLRQFDKETSLKNNNQYDFKLSGLFNTVFVSYSRESFTVKAWKCFHCLSRPIHFKKLSSRMLLGPFLNTLTYIKPLTITNLLPNYSLL